MNKTKFLTIAVVLLIILNATTLFFLFARHSKGSHREREGGKNFTEFISKQLNFDSSQTKQLRAFRDAHKADFDSLRNEDKTLHDSLAVLVKKGNIDSAKLNSYLSLIAENKKKFELGFVNHFSQIRSLCKPEQIDSFNKMVDQMMKRRTPSYGNKNEKDSRRK